MSKEVIILHVVNEGHLGGGCVHIKHLLIDSRNLGYKVGVATFEDGIITKELGEEGIPVYLMSKEEDLVDIVKNEGYTITHGHSCAGQYFNTRVCEGISVNGQTVHSFVSRSGNMEGDFEVVELESLQKVRPGSHLIRWAMYDENKFKITKSKKEIREEFGIPQNAYLIGRNGRLDGAKAPDEFIRCLATLTKMSNRFWGLMVGDGVIYKDLRNLAENLGCSNNLVMPGTRRDQGNMFNAMDCVVYPTHDESVCAGVVEPLFIKKPVVCYCVGGMHETIIHGMTGLHARNVNELVQSVIAFVNQPKEAKELGEQGYKHVVAQGHLDHIGEAKKHIQMYQELLNKSSS